MLKITVPGSELYDEASKKFIKIDAVDLELEHSLVSLSKWEEEFEKPFLDPKPKTAEELVSYVKCMTLTPEIPPEVFTRLSQENFETINAYLNQRMTATWFRDTPGAPRAMETITAELIYYWMTVLSIPFTCDEWNLNKLFTLIKVCNFKQAKPKKMGRGEAADQQRRINEQRRQELRSRG